MNQFYVYIWYKFKNNRWIAFYIGKGMDNRYTQTEKSRNIYFKRTIAKYKCKVKLYKTNLSENDAFTLEKQLIDAYTKKGIQLTNLTNGGEGSSGWFKKKTKKEQEAHREVSKSFLGKKHTNETRKRMSESAKERHRRHPMTNETRKKISETRIKKYKSGEIADKRKMPINVYKNDKLVEQYESVMECLLHFKNRTDELKYNNTRIVYESLKTNKTIGELRPNTPKIQLKPYRFQYAEPQSTIESE